MSLFFTILIYLVAGIGSLVLIVLFAPIAISASFTFTKLNRNGTLKLSWFSPAIFQLNFDAVAQSLQLSIFWWKHPVSANSQKQPSADSKSTSQSTSDFSAKNQPVPSRTESAKSSPANPPPEAKSSKPDTTAQDPHSDNPAIPKNIKARRTLFSHLHSIKKIWSIINQFGFRRKAIQWLFRIIASLFKTIRFEHLSLHAYAGVKDPAKLGKIYGYFIACRNCILQEAKNIKISMDPAFMEDRLDLTGRIKIRSSLAMIFYPVFIGVVTFPYIETFIIWRRLKKVFR